MNRALWICLFWLGYFAFPAHAADSAGIGLDVGLGVHGYRPLGAEITETYDFGFGLAGEFAVEYGRDLRLIVMASPTYSAGTPLSGPLATDASARLWHVPLTAGLQVLLTTDTRWLPYVGAGGTFHYVQEQLSFNSGIGPRSATESFTGLGWHLRAGVEQSGARRFFGELMLLMGKVGGTDLADDGLAMGGLQVRFGYRIRVK